MSDLYTFSAVGIIALVTALTRFLPFIVFGEKLKTPKSVETLGKLLPYSIMGMLVVYCLKDISLLSISDFLPQTISLLVVILLYILKRNTLLSIIAGTLCNMILLQFVF